MSKMILNKALLKRLTKANLLRKDGMFITKYDKAANALVTNGSNLKQREIKLYLRYWSGYHKRHINLVECFPNIETVLEAIGIDYEVGNDAPRGGAAGDYLLIHGRPLGILRKNIKTLKTLIATT